MRNDQIDELQEELTRLRIDFERSTNSINKQLAKLRNQQDRNNDRRRSSDSADTTVLRLGDVVVITNDYKYIEKGVVGTVTKFNKSGDRVTIIDKYGKPYIRAPWNLKRIDNKSE